MTIALVSVVALALILNIVWASIWYYRKTQTLEYRIKKFVRKEKIAPRLGRTKIEVSEDALLQLFLRCKNEDLRPDLKQPWYREEAVGHFNLLLKKIGKKYTLNYDSPYLSKDDPVSPPDGDDPDLMVL